VDSFKNDEKLISGVKVGDRYYEYDYKGLQNHTGNIVTVVRVTGLQAVLSNDRRFSRVTGNTIGPDKYTVFYLPVTSTREARPNHDAY
jgi:hypothetical protein